MTKPTAKDNGYFDRLAEYGLIPLWEVIKTLSVQIKSPKPNSAIGENLNTEKRVLMQ